MKILKEHYKLILSFIFLLCLIFIAFLIKKNYISNFDNFVYHYLSLGISPKLTNIYKIITSLSSAIMVVVVAILMLVLIKNKKYGILSSINLINVVLLNQLLKIIFSRERPNILMLIDEKGYSFPSGHAMTSTAFYGFIIYLIWKTNIKQDKKILFTVILSSIILLVSISRIYLGVHYASDVIGGICISLVYLIFYINLIKKYLSNMI